MSQSFPSKFKILPGIPGAHYVESLGSGEQLVPVQKDRIDQGICLESDSILERLKQLEMRVITAERSNQALVEEMVCMKNVLK